MKTKSKWGRFAAPGVLLGALFAIIVFRSSPPDGWEDVNVGVPRGSVISSLGASHSDQRLVKGFELWKTGATRCFGVAGYWQMLVSYDADERVSFREYSFVPFESGTRNRWIPERMLYRMKIWSRDGTG